MTDKPTLEILQGLPASGKSTYARKEVEAGHGKVKRVNKDSIREMIDAGKFSRSNERAVLFVRDTIIDATLNDPRVEKVIVDDTNFPSKGLDALIQKFDERTTIKFTVFDTSLGECIERDQARANGVGARVIQNFHAQHIAKLERALGEQDESLPKAIICDIDGTLARMVDRGPFDYSKVSTDVIVPSVRSMVRALEGNGECLVLVMSGRDSVCYRDTLGWLHVNNVPFNALFMRAEGDNREDSIIKRELFDAHIRGKYNVICVLDDRNRVVDMWRRLGLTCLQVGDGNF